MFASESLKLYGTNGFSTMIALRSFGLTCKRLRRQRVRYAAEGAESERRCALEIDPLDVRRENLRPLGQRDAVVPSTEDTLELSFAMRSMSLRNTAGRREAGAPSCPPTTQSRWRRCGAVARHRQSRPLCTPRLRKCSARCAITGSGPARTHAPHVRGAVVTDVEHDRGALLHAALEQRARGAGAATRRHGGSRRHRLLQRRVTAGARAQPMQ
jgi:hypothetical protein